MNQTVYLKNFLRSEISFSQSLHQALAQCRSQRARVLEFPAGEYDLTDWVQHQTASIAHDDGCGSIDRKACHILLQNFDQLTLRGALDQAGKPATLLCGWNDQQNQSLLPSILWVEGCQNLTLENLAFTRKPITVHTGEVVSLHEGRGIETRLLQPEFAYDGMASYCMNRIEKDGRLAYPSLTFGFGYDQQWKKINDSHYFLADANMAKTVQVGHFLSWHQSGKTDFLLFFEGCKELKLKNIRIYNSNSFALLTQRCHNIYADKVVIKPKYPNYFVASRDGWKVYRCSGDIRLYNCHIEGVRMDGQNVHSNYLTLHRPPQGNTLYCLGKYAPIPLESHSSISFYSLKGEELVTRLILDWEVCDTLWESGHSANDPTAAQVVGGVKNPLPLYRITLDKPVSETLPLNSLGVAECWQPSTYLCQKSCFRNIAGAGQLLRVSHIAIEDCEYENIMNAGVLMGAELSTHGEADHVSSVRIQGCQFKNCGFKPRYGQYGSGGIAIKSQGFQAPVNHSITITDNYFSDSATGIELQDARQVNLIGNKFFHVDQPLKIEAATTLEIKNED